MLPFVLDAPLLAQPASTANVMSLITLWLTRTTDLPPLDARTIGRERNGVPEAKVPNSRIVHVSRGRDHGSTCRACIV
jgi:hypothetical protein